MSLFSQNTLTRQGRWLIDETRCTISKGKLAKWRTEVNVSESWPDVVFDPMFAELQVQQQGDVQRVRRTGEPLVDGERENATSRSFNVYDREFGGDEAGVGDLEEWRKKENGLPMSLYPSIILLLSITHLTTDGMLEPTPPMGTVGAVALDIHGHLAAATSTGGMVGKRWGRVGDSPIIGGGTFADDKTAAVSCTGHGEYFIRHAVAHDVCACLEYSTPKCSLAEASARILAKFKTFGDDFDGGGFIAVSPTGEIQMPFSSKGMYRASLSSCSPQQAYVGIWGDDDPLEREMVLQWNDFKKSSRI